MVNPGIAIGEYEAAAQALKFAHREFLEAEIAHRQERRRAEHRIRDGNKHLPAGAAELLIEADPLYGAARDRLTRAQYERTGAIGYAEAQKLRAWLAVRSVGS